MQLPKSLMILSVWMSRFKEHHSHTAATRCTNHVLVGSSLQPRQILKLSSLEFFKIVIVQCAVQAAIQRVSGRYSKSACSAHCSHARSVHLHAVFTHIPPKKPYTLHGRIRAHFSLHAPAGLPASARTLPTTTSWSRKIHPNFACANKSLFGSVVRSLFSIAVAASAATSAYLQRHDPITKIWVADSARALSVSDKTLS